jgi:ribosomal protein S18 acetylase RimI-like enzyme
VTAPVAIRRARPDDAAALTALAHAAKRHWGYPETWLRLWRPQLTLDADFVARHGVWCAVDGDAIVGFCAVSVEGRLAELEHLWVDPGRLRARVGRRLFEHAAGVLRARGATRLGIVADPNAEGFYAAMGARRVGTVPSQPAGRTLPRLVFDLTGEREVE